MGSAIGRIPTRVRVTLSGLDQTPWRRQFERIHLEPNRRPREIPARQSSRPAASRAGRIPSHRSRWTITASSNRQERLCDHLRPPAVSGFAHGRRFPRRLVDCPNLMSAQSLGPRPKTHQQSAVPLAEDQSTPKPHPIPRRSNHGRLCGPELFSIPRRSTPKSVQSRWFNRSRRPSQCGIRTGVAEDSTLNRTHDRIGA